MLSTVQIVCEGKCNPGLRQYDAACRRWARWRYGTTGVRESRGGRGDPLQPIVSAVRQLRHTPHELVADRDRVLGSAARCTVCGRVRPW